MLTLFVVLVPLLVLYATGYRFNLFNIGDTFRVVGGLYVSTDVDESNIVLNGAPIENFRIFQRAAYIQNVPAGVHEVYVNAPGVATWVKELPVFSHFVTEARSFNMPLVPQVRVITPWLHATSGASVLFEATSSTPFAGASTSNTFFFSSSTATSSYIANTEFAYIETLFASSTEAKSPPAHLQVPFLSDQQPTSSATTTATTTRLKQNSKLYKANGEVYVTWEGDQRSIPYYYCVNYQGATSTAELYGEHVWKQLASELASSSVLFGDLQRSETICRSTIRIDRGYSEVKWFDFMPDNSDLVLMLLNDGLYVVEADDRAWQNMQLLYKGEDIEVVVDGSSIYVRDGSYTLVVGTELQTQ